MIEMESGTRMHKSTKSINDESGFAIHGSTKTAADTDSSDTAGNTFIIKGRKQALQEAYSRSLKAKHSYYYVTSLFSHYWDWPFNMVVGSKRIIWGWRTSQAHIQLWFKAMRNLRQYCSLFFYSRRAHYYGWSNRKCKSDWGWGFVDFDYWTIYYSVC